MNEHKGKIKSAFWQATNNEPPNKQKAGEISEMLKKDRPIYRPKPPVLAQTLEAQSFASRWQVDVDTHKQISPEQANKSKETVTQQFNRARDPLDQITDKHRDRGISR